MGWVPAQRREGGLHPPKRIHQRSLAALSEKNNRKIHSKPKIKELRVVGTLDWGKKKKKAKTFEHLPLATHLFTAHGHLQKHSPVAGDTDTSSHHGAPQTATDPSRRSPGGTWVPQHRKRLSATSIREEHWTACQKDNYGRYP